MRQLSSSDIESDESEFLLSRPLRSPTICTFAHFCRHPHDFNSDMRLLG